jgi:hypothetical protein
MENVKKKKKFTEVKQLVTYLGLAGIGLNYSRNMKEIWVFILHLIIAYSSIVYF